MHCFHIVLLGTFLREIMSIASLNLQRLQIRRSSNVTKQMNFVYASQTKGMRLKPRILLCRMLCSSKSRGSIKERKKKERERERERERGGGERK